MNFRACTKEHNVSTGKLLIIALVVPTAISLVLGYSRRKRDRSSLQSYFRADQTLDAVDETDLFVSTSLALGNAVLFFAWLGYRVGLAALWLQVAWCAGFFLVRPFADRIRQLATNGTLHGNLTVNYGNYAGIFAAIASLIGFGLNLGWELAAGSSIFALVTTSRYFGAFVALLLAIVAAGYTIVGGLRGNLRANRFQNYFSYLALVAVVIALGASEVNGKRGVATLGWESLNPFSGALIAELGWGGFLSTMFLSVTWQFVDMSAWQNIAASKANTPASRRALLWTPIILFLMPGVTAVLAGIFMREQSGLTADSVVPAMVAGLVKYPIVFLLVVGGFIAAMLSTVDGFLLAGGQAATWDIFCRKTISSVRDHELETLDAAKATRLLDTAKLLMMALAIVGTSVVVGLMLFTKLNLFNIVYLAYSGQIVLLPSVTKTLVLPNRRANGTASILTGLIVAYGCGVFALIAEYQSLLTWSPLIGTAAASLGLLLPGQAHSENQRGQS